MVPSPPRTAYAGDVIPVHISLLKMSPRQTQHAEAAAAAAEDAGTPQQRRRRGSILGASLERHFLLYNAQRSIVWRRGLSEAPLDSLGYGEPEHSPTAHAFNSVLTDPQAERLTAAIGFTTGEVAVRELFSSTVRWFNAGVCWRCARLSPAFSPGVHTLPSPSPCPTQRALTKAPVTAVRWYGWSGCAVAFVVPSRP